ncbi:MAG: hypothetical protein Ct9H90mV2_100 [Prasinovirus sp.]|nr:MAG: hypothetical protein Ct9H90mV2_100 [Prasinovirus sp.]
MQSVSTNITTFPGKVGISNANPTHTLAIGSNVYVDDTGSNKLTVTGIISGDGLGISNIQTANVLGLTDNVSRITTLETDLGDNSTRITTVSNDLSDNSSRITTVSNDLSDNSSRITTVSNDLSDNSSRITTVSNDLSDNSSRITTVSNDLSDNSSRIDSLGDGAHTFTGVKTFEDDIILESNLRVNGSLTYANTVNMIVSDPIIELGANNQHTNDLGLVLTRHGNSGNDSNVTIFYDESQDNLKIGYTDNSAAETTLTTTTTGLDVSITGNVAAAYDTDTTSYFGRAALGFTPGNTNQASFAHVDMNTAANFGLKQAASGVTHINCPAAKHIRFSVNASEVGRFTGGGDFKVGNNPVKFYVDTALSEVQMYSQATGSTAGPDLVLMRDNPNNGGNNEYIGQIRYEGLSSTGTSRLYAKTTGKIKTATNNAEDGVIETMIKTGGSNRISVRHSGAKFLITNGTDLQVGEVANLYVDTSTSRVGINVASPSYTLDVGGDINLSGSFYQGGSPFVSSLWTSSGTDLYYSSGSVGISNAAPDHDLSVGSNLYVHDTGSNVLVVDGNVNVSNNLTAHRLTLNNVSITTTQDLAQVSNVGNVTSNVLQFTNPTTAFVTTGNVEVGGELTVGSNVEIGTANLFVDTTSGDVGIGTTVPAATLDVRGAVADPSIPTVHIGDNSADGGDYGMVNLVRDGTNGGSKSHLAFIRYGHTVVGMGFHNNTNTWGIFPSFSGVTNTPAMAITFDGKIGIGTASPLEKLDVYGTSRISSAYPRLDFFCTTGRSTNAWGNSTGAAGDYRIYSNSDASDATKRSLNFDYGQNTTHTTRMCISAAGNVGIGTATPDGPLHVFKAGGNAGDVGGGIKMERWDNYGCAIWSQYPSGGTVDCMAFRCVNNASDAYGGTPQMVLTHEGRVGIGTSNPVDMLDVVADVAWGGIKLKTSTNNVLKLGRNGTADGGFIEMFNNGVFTTFISAYGNSHFNGGDFGIGTASPSSKLHVNGRIMSNQPRFFAWSNSGSVGFSGSGPIVLNSTAYNSGSHYSTGTGYFTAPVNGVYHFTVGVYTYNATQFSWKLVPTAGSLSNNNAHVSRNNNSGDDLLLVQAFNSGQHGGSITIYLNANEQFGWGSRSSSGNYYGAHSHFSGYLLSQV